MGKTSTTQRGNLRRHDPPLRGMVPRLLAAAAAVAVLVLAIVAGPGVVGTAEAIEEVEKALANEDQDGIDVAVLAEGKAALEAGDRERGRSLLVTEGVGQHAVQLSR